MSIPIFPHWFLIRPIYANIYFRFQSIVTVLFYSVVISLVLRPFTLRSGPFGLEVFGEDNCQSRSSGDMGRLTSLDVSGSSLTTVVVPETGCVSFEVHNTRVVSFAPCRSKVVTGRGVMVSPACPRIGAPSSDQPLQPSDINEELVIRRRGTRFRKGGPLRRTKFKITWLQH